MSNVLGCVRGCARSCARTRGCAQNVVQVVRVRWEGCAHGRAHEVVHKGFANIQLAQRENVVRVELHNVRACAAQHVSA